VLKDTHDRAVDDDFLEIGILGQCREDALPHAAFRPPCKPLLDTVPVAELLRQSAPSTAPPRRTSDCPQRGARGHPVCPAAGVPSAPIDHRADSDVQQVHPISKLGELYHVKCQHDLGPAAKTWPLLETAMPTPM
jgi:hypothetical protein